MAAVFPEVNPLPRSQLQLAAAKWNGKIHCGKRGADVGGHVVGAFGGVDEKAVAIGYDFGEEGFKIAADIACFESHHLNHLTPNTLCMDLYTAAMKHCMGELGEAEFLARATGIDQRVGAKNPQTIRAKVSYLTAAGPKSATFTRNVGSTVNVTGFKDQ